MHFTEYDTRVAAYAVITDADRILLSWWNGDHVPGRAAWTLPGGGIDYGEQIEEGLVREIHEETGYTAELTSFLTTHSFAGTPTQRTGRPFKAVRLVFTAAITGGTLGTLEVDGSTDRAEWIRFDEIDTAGPHVELVDVALSAWRSLHR